MSRHPAARTKSSTKGAKTQRRNAQPAEHASLALRAEPKHKSASSQKAHADLSAHTAENSALPARAKPSSQKYAQLRHKTHHTNLLQHFGNGLHRTRRNTND